MDIREQIRNFIASNLVIYEDNAKFGDDDDIFKAGFVDSMFALKLVQYVEKEHSLRVENDDLQLANFNSVANIAKFIARKKAG
ncbi:MAG: acyl carrier protein [Myxococcota bacterium]